MSAREDYPDFEAAIQAASSRFGATHVVRQGNRSAIIYSPTSKGYERRSLSCDRGFFHWPKQADLVDEVPENAERVVDVLDLGFDPDAPPRREVAPQRRAAEEARGSDRERWEKLQAEFNRLGDEMTKVEVEAHVKWGPHGIRYASRGLQTKHEKLKAARNRVFEKIFAMTQKLSPRDWGSGVPTHWIAGKLTFNDMVRPQSEPLSVTPPLAYGATKPMQEASEASEARLPPVVRVHPPESPNKVARYVIDRHRRVGGRQEYTVLGWDQRNYLVQVISGFGPSALLDKARELWPDARFDRPNWMKEEPMGAVREVMENRGREGRRYESAQWLEFECEPATPTPELEDMAREFNHLALEFLESYARTWSIDTSSLDADSFTWNAYASLVGHGVGLWEGDGDTGLRGEDEKKIDKALRSWHAAGSARGKLHNLAHQISNECSMLSEGAGGREASEEAAIPTKAQLKIIDAFRARSLRGNPMRDSISTDGETIYSYQMPIAGRNPRGGIWIADPASAPSATTRNHIYGLQRTFTPAEIAGGSGGHQHMLVRHGSSRCDCGAIWDPDKGWIERGQRAADHDDDRGPDTERAPAPEAAPRLQPGYAFYTPSKRKGDWKKIPDDDWEHVVVGEDEIEKSNLVGMRLIDGSMHDIFEVYFSAYPREGRGYYAQLQTHTRGRSAAHEENEPSDLWIKIGTLSHNRDFSVRDFVDYTGHSESTLRRLVTNGDVRKTGRRYYPTAAGWARIEAAYSGRAHEFPGGPATAWASDFPSPKDAIAHAQHAWGATHVDFHGTRNRPTVYGTKDGARWKKTLFKEKGKFHWPDKFSKGPKRLSGAIELTPAAPTHAPVQHRASPMPDDDFERHLPGHADEARRTRHYVTRPSPGKHLRDDVFLDNVQIGHVMGPLQRSQPHHSDFYEWELYSLSAKTAPPFGLSATFGTARSRKAAIDALTLADQKRRERQGTREASEGRRDPTHLMSVQARVQDLWKRGRSLAQIEDELNVTIVVPGGIADQSPNILRGNFRVDPGINEARRRTARENPATDLQDAIPWVRVTRDPERYKEAIARAQKIGPIDDARKVYDLVGPALIKEDQETFIVVLIDVRQNCRGVAEIHRGQRSRVATSVLDVMRVVVASGAEGFIVVHNHPSGKAMPSDADRSLTKAIERAARPFKGETAFLDHVVCGAGEYFSFADNKLHKARN